MQAAHEQAIAACQREILADRLNPKGYFRLAMAEQAAGKNDDALQNYVRAAKLQPDWLLPLERGWEMLMQAGRMGEALPFAVQLCITAPQEEAAWNHYRTTTAQLPEFYEVEKAMQPALQIALQGGITASVRATAVRHVLFSGWMVKLAALYDVNASEAFDARLYDALGDASLLKQMADSLLPALMQRSVIPQATLERVLTQLRRRFLLGMGQGERQENLALLLSLWALCFNNEYVFFAGADEQAAVDALRTRLADSPMPEITDIALLGCYTPLANEAVAERVEQWRVLHPHQVLVQQCIREQILNPQDEQRRRANLPVLNEITDETSRKVRAQYESAPYPRWRELPPTTQSSLTEYVLRFGAKPYWVKPMADAANQVLIAGCGTGRHPIMLAKSLPQCEVLAVDISLSSLAYAQRKAEELEVKNLRFMQADILSLRELNRRFDYVESVGVLHHLRDPMAGWQVLTDILKPHGMMRIGLYSRHARNAVIAARERISRRGLGQGDDAIRQFRREVMQKGDSSARDLFMAADFFSLSDCRDLLFHVQEHQFTWPQIGQAVEQLGLNFCGVQLTDNPALAAFDASQPRAVAADYFTHWDAFEQAQPKTFAGMYHFWLQKPLN